MEFIAQVHYRPFTVAKRVDDQQSLRVGDPLAHPGVKGDELVGY
jgi:hypothetical protein